MITIEVFRMNEKTLRNIHLHEARLSRRRERELAELQAMQYERSGKEADAERATASASHNSPASHPPPQQQPKTTTAAACSTENGFEFANPSAAPANPSSTTAEAPEFSHKNPA
jgi:hypothetical protein